MMPEPYLEASHGKAWKAGHHFSRALVAAYIIEAPWAHPVWSCYALSVIHLRNEPDLPPAIIYLEGATHEVCLYALNPEWKPDWDERPHYLTPANYTGQIICDTDTEAADRLERAVQAIIEGRLNPDTDALSQWVALFGDSNIRK